MTVQAADVRGHMARILNDETRLLQSLEALLQQETAVVRGDDIEAIEQVGQKRHDCMAALTRLEAERSASCRMLSFGDGRAAFERLLVWCDAGGALLRTWQTNLLSARRCKDLNDRNGAIVAVKLNHVHKLLTVIRGGAPSPVYAPQNLRQAVLASRALGQA